MCCDCTGWCEHVSARRKFSCIYAKGSVDIEKCTVDALGSEKVQIRTRRKVFALDNMFVPSFANELVTYKIWERAEQQNFNSNALRIVDRQRIICFAQKMRSLLDILMDI